MLYHGDAGLQGSSPDIITQRNPTSTLALSSLLGALDALSDCVDVHSSVIEGLLEDMALHDSDAACHRETSTITAAAAVEAVAGSSSTCTNPKGGGPGSKPGVAQGRCMGLKRSHEVSEVSDMVVMEGHHLQAWLECLQAQQDLDTALSNMVPA